jgi:hypothetical protein
MPSEHCSIRSQNRFPWAWFNFPVKITSMNEVAVHFHGSDQTGSVARATSVTGIINRLTGDVEADTEGQFNLRYALKCRPTQRMF